MNPSSLDRHTTTADGNGGPISALIADPHSADPGDIVAEGMDPKADVAAITAGLARGERSLVERRFGLNGHAPTTLTATARALGVDRDATPRATSVTQDAKRG